MIRVIAALGVFGMLITGGCVSVDAGSTHVEVGPSHLFHSSEDKPQETGYAKAVKRISHRQTKVSKELTKGQWDDTVHEADVLLNESRQLGGYAGTSYDPRLFQQYSQEVVGVAQAVYQAAVRQDDVACRRALEVSASTMARFTRAFPLTVPEAMQTAYVAANQRQAAASAAPPPRRAPQAP